MIKKKIYGNTLKKQLQASSSDRLYNFMLENGAVRGVILHGTRMINEMRANHELGVMETLVLGRAYLACGLLSANLKGSDRVSIQVECSGVIKGFAVETNAYNEVRGYLKNVPIPIVKPLENFDLSPFFGAGFLTVTKYLEDKKTPFSGQVVLQYGNIAKDLAHYFLVSEQIPTSFTLSIYFNSQGAVTGAGAMFLQVMPDADESTIRNLEKIINNFPSIGEAFSNKKTPDQLVIESLAEYSPEIIGNTRVEFMCHCKKEQMFNYFSALPVKDIMEIAQNGPFPVEIKCHNCNTYYHFEENEIKRILKKKTH